MFLKPESVVQSPEPGFSPGKEMLTRRCSHCGKTFQRPNVANAAQMMAVDFLHHNRDYHEGAATLSTPESVWTA